jgi:hypothetical protein
LVFGAAVAGFWWGLSPRTPFARSAPLSRATDSFPERDLHWLGVGSCSAAACHGGTGPPGSKGSEYTTWAACDPHANAFSVLYDERSARIVKNLNGPNAKPACADRRCLSCHATSVKCAVQTPRLALEDGVGCQSCHGPADEWLTQHYQPGWKMLSPRDKAQWGMRDTKDLVVRAKVCAECHVGAGGDKDVNHDLIAAGHPRLTFEYSSYLAILPKHWSVQEEVARYPDFEARAWAIGQVASAAQALKLLAYRACPATDAKPWPEFGEYNCFACHHDLREPRQGLKRKFAGGLPGRLPWGTWYFSDLLPKSLDLEGLGKAPRDFPAFIGRVRTEMEQPLPDREKAATLAQGAARHLERWLHDLGNTECRAPATLVEWFERVKSNKTLAGRGWDKETQWYLALAALYNAAGDVKPGALGAREKAALEKMANQLAFPKGYDSPFEFKPRTRNKAPE